MARGYPFGVTIKGTGISLFGILLSLFYWENPRPGHCVRVFLLGLLQN